MKRCGGEKKSSNACVACQRRSQSKPMPNARRSKTTASQRSRYAVARLAFSRTGSNAATALALTYQYARGVPFTVSLAVRAGRDGLESRRHLLPGSSVVERAAPWSRAAPWGNSGVLLGELRETYGVLSPRQSAAKPGRRSGKVQRLCARRLRPAGLWRRDSPRPRETAGFCVTARSEVRILPREQSDPSETLSISSAVSLAFRARSVFCASLKPEI